MVKSGFHGLGIVIPILVTSFLIALGHGLGRRDGFSLSSPRGLINFYKCNMLTQISLIFSNCILIGYAVYSHFTWRKVFQEQK